MSSDDTSIETVETFLSDSDDEQEFPNFQPGQPGQRNERTSLNVCEGAYLDSEDDEEMGDVDEEPINPLPFNQQAGAQMDPNENNNED